MWYISLFTGMWTYNLWHYDAWGFLWIRSHYYAIPGSPQRHDPLASDSQVLKSQVYTITLSPHPVLCVPFTVSPISFAIFHNSDINDVKIYAEWITKVLFLISFYLGWSKLLYSEQYHKEILANTWGYLLGINYYG